MRTCMALPYYNLPIHCCPLDSDTDWEADLLVSSTTGDSGTETEIDTEEETELLQMEE